MILEQYKNSSRGDKNLIKVFLLLLIVGLLIGSIFIVRAAINTEPTDPEKKPVEYNAELGEYSYLGYPVAYPPLESKNMNEISVWYVDEESGLNELSFALTREGASV